MCVKAASHTSHTSHHMDPKDRHLLIVPKKESTLRITTNQDSYYTASLCVRPFIPPTTIYHLALFSFDLPSCFLTTTTILPSLISHSQYNLSLGFNFHCLTIEIGIVVLSEANDLAFLASEVISPNTNEIRKSINKTMPRS